jgi:hypothetical protein
MALPSQAITRTVPVPAPDPAEQLKGEDAVTGETAYTGVLPFPLELRNGLFAANNPVNMVDPSGQSFIGDLVLRASAFASMAAYYLGPVVTYGRIALAGATLAAFVAQPEFAGGYVSSLGGPGNAAVLLAAEIRIVGNAGVNLFRHGTVRPNVINIQFNGGDANDFRVKTADLQRAAQRGDLVVVNNPSRIRKPSAQEAYRDAVFNRYVNYLKEIGMTEQQATAQAAQKFKSLHVDHRIDLQVSGGLTDPNANTNLRMLDGTVNTSVGSQLAKEIERLGLQAGDQIHQVNIIGAPQ